MGGMLFISAAIPAKLLWELCIISSLFQSFCGKIQFVFPLFTNLMPLLIIPYLIMLCFLIRVSLCMKTKCNVQGPFFCATPAAAAGQVGSTLTSVFGLWVFQVGGVCVCVCRGEVHSISSHLNPFKSFIESRIVNFGTFNAGLRLHRSDCAGL